MINSNDNIGKEKQTLGLVNFRLKPQPKMITRTVDIPVLSNRREMGPERKCILCLTDMECQRYAKTNSGEIYVYRCNHRDCLMNYMKGAIAKNAGTIEIVYHKPADENQGVSFLDCPFCKARLHMEDNEYSKKFVTYHGECKTEKCIVVKVHILDHAEYTKVTLSCDMTGNKMDRRISRYG